jgi:hypothetical protein
MLISRSAIISNDHDERIVTKTRGCRIAIIIITTEQKKDYFCYIIILVLIVHKKLSGLGERKGKYDSS